MVKYLMGLTQKPAGVATVVILWMLLLLLPLFQKFVLLFPTSCNIILTNLLHLLILIKRPPFIYIIFNFIIVYILISSTFSLHLKFYKKEKSCVSALDDNPLPKPKLKLKRGVDDEILSSSLSCSQNNHDGSGSGSGLEILSSWEGDDDPWWRQIVEDEGTTTFRGGVEEEVVDDVEEGKTASFEPLPDRVVVAESSEKEEENKENIDIAKKVDEEEEGDDTLDATWEAIMEAKKKGSGPQLKKSDTWTAGDRRGGEERLARNKKQVELKKCRTFKGALQERENGKTGGGGGGGGGGRGWRKMEALFTDHDELKKRSEAFIAQFIHDIQLQRLESEQRFFETINRGL